MNTGNGNEHQKPHWIVESFGGVNIIVLAGALMAATYYVFEIRASQANLTDKISHLEVELDGLIQRNTEIAQLGWKMENIQTTLGRASVKIENLQEAMRNAQASIRDLERAGDKP